MITTVTLIHQTRRAQCKITVATETYNGLCNMDKQVQQQVLLRWKGIKIHGTAFT